jgi:hypothetical protein
MGRIKFIIAGLAVMLVPVFVWAGVAGAQRFSASVDEGEVVNSSLYSAGQNVDINGTINGDVFCAGQNVRIDATVQGDIICAGQSVTIKGSVEGDIRVAGQTVSIDANVARSLTVAAQTFSLDADARVGGDATLMGDTFNIKGGIGRDAVLGGTTVMLSGTVGRNVEATVQHADVRANTQIGGNLIYTSDNDAAIATGAKIAGEVTHRTPETQTETFAGIGMGVYLYFLAAFLLIALVLVLLFPQAVRKTNDIAHRGFGKTLLVGFLSGFAVPLAAFALAITFVGLPLAIVLLMLWGVLIALSVPIAGYFLIRLVFKRGRNTVLVTLAGTAVAVTLCFVPFLGFFVSLFVYWIGAGALLLALRRHVPSPEYHG